MQQNNFRAFDVPKSNILISGKKVLPFLGDAIDDFDQKGPKNPKIFMRMSQNRTFLFST
jgi:hypothetical protein